MYIKSSKYRNNEPVGLPSSDLDFFEVITSNIFGKVKVWKSENKLDELFSELAKIN